MKRKIYNRFLEWKKDWDGRAALLVDGARRVGYPTRSLDKFRNKYASCLGQSYILHTEDLKITQDAVYLPLYMAGML